MRPNTASIEDIAWVLCKRCNIAKGTQILLEIIRTVPPEALKPMLLQKHANEIIQLRFEKVTVIIYGKQFTKVKLINGIDSNKFTLSHEALR